jgi:hypothetical protein
VIEVVGLVVIWGVEVVDVGAGVVMVVVRGTDVVGDVGNEVVSAAVACVVVGAAGTVVGPAELKPRSHAATTITRRANARTVREGIFRPPLQFHDDVVSVPPFL